MSLNTCVLVTKRAVVPLRKTGKLRKGKGVGLSEGGAWFGRGSSGLDISI